MFLTIIISLVCVYFGYVLLCRQLLPRVNEEVPTHPGRLPLIGHSYMWLKNETLVQSVISFGEYAVKVGGVTKVFMGPLPIYVVADPVDVVTVLNKCLKKMFVYRFVEPMVGNTLMAADVPTWKRNRRILDLCFKQHILDEFLEFFTERGERFVELLAEEVGKGEVDLIDKISTSVVETACRTTLGHRIDGKDLIDNNFMMAIKDMLGILVARINKPWLMFDFIFNLSTYKTKLNEAIEVATALTRPMLETRKSEHLQRLKNKEDLDRKGDKFQSILEVFLENTMTETSSIFSDADLRNLMDNVMVGGFDTTIGQMQYIFSCIGSYPEVQEKIYQEVTQVLGENGGVTKQNISQLVYLEAALKECMRLYPVVCMVAREAIVDTKLRNVTIPAGSSVLVHIRGVHRHPDYWGEDAEEFKPERWLSPDTPKHKAAFASFSPGLRGCIGKTYALLFLKANMAPVLRRFKLTADHTKMKLECGVMVKPVAGHLVRIEERRPNK